MGICQRCFHRLGRPNVSHLIMLRKVKFYKHLFLSTNGILFKMLWTVFMPQCEAAELVYHLFDAYVG